MCYFNYHNFTTKNGLKWEFAQALIDFQSQLYLKAISQSKQKSQFTMNASQAGKYRSPELKYQMQLMGILAEIYSQEYLMEIIAKEELTSHWNVVRYDDVRTDGFKSPANEYDIKILSVDGTKDFKVECRSSISHDRSFKSAIEQFDIIGPYSSFAKSGEGIADFFIRPLYEFLPFATQKYLPINFEKHLKAEEIKLHLEAACTKNDMIEKGYNKSMNQSGTLYRAIKIVDGYDVNGFNKMIALALK